MLDSCFLDFKFSNSETKNLAIGDFVSLEDISAGGHQWKIHCYPCGRKEAERGEFVSVFLHLISYSKDDKVIFHVLGMGKDGEPSFSSENKLVHVLSSEGSTSLGWSLFMKRSILEANYVIDDQITLICGIIVVRDNTIAVPSSEIGYELGLLFDCKVGADVAFIVKGETILAHRVILAARSPVFKAELFGYMADATSPSITLQDIEPATVKAMLWFMYTDELPNDNEIEDSSTEMMLHLLSAADRHALDRLKLLCARRLWDDISVDTFASTLGCAELHNCPELKCKCIDFFVVENNFKKIVFTDGFRWLVRTFPPLAAKLKEKVGI